MGKKIKPSETAEELLRDILIVLLAQNGASQGKIRETLSVDMYRVSRIVKNLNPNRYGKNN
jgi:DNA-binding MarR family transcriptional regulator